RAPAYREEYKTFATRVSALGSNTAPLLDMPLLPDPDKVRIRVYQTNSTHKSMSALRQGSMILVWDEDFHKVEGPFEERSSRTPPRRPTSRSSPRWTSPDRSWSWRATSRRCRRRSWSRG